MGQHDSQPIKRKLKPTLYKCSIELRGKYAVGHVPLEEGQDFDPRIHGAKKWPAGVADRDEVLYCTVNGRWVLVECRPIDGDAEYTHEMRPVIISGKQAREWFLKHLPNDLPDDLATSYKVEPPQAPPPSDSVVDPRLETPTESLCDRTDSGERSADLADSGQDDAVSSIPPRAQKAWGEYQMATESLGTPNATDQEAYDCLAKAFEASGESADLPTFGTWSRNLRLYRNAMRQQKSTPRAGRAAGRSARVRLDDVEPKHLPASIRPKHVDE